MMFSIMYENKSYHQWSDKYIFESFEDAKEYLERRGFVERNRLFYREDYNWNEYMKAYISPREAWIK